MIGRYSPSPAVILALILAALIAGAFGLSKFKAMYYANKAEHLKAEVVAAKADAVVARQDEAQAAQSAQILASTTQAQDAHLSAARASTTKAVEAIHARIKTAPMAAPVPADPLILLIVANARDRAQAAGDRVSGEAGSGPVAEHP